MNDLVTFLSERFDEDERIARAADGISRDSLLDLYEDLIKSRPFDDQRRAYGIHISHFTPGKALTDIFAKRQILEEVLRIVPPNLAVDCGQTTILKALALPYASHHEYRNEWKP